MDNGPLHALQNGVSGGNGVYRYGSAERVPERSLQSDELLGRRGVHAGRGGPDTTPPTVVGRSPASGATAVPAGTPVTATFSEAHRSGHGDCHHGRAALCASSTLVTATVT